MNKQCGHEPNPPTDVDKNDRPYESCFQCFIEDVEKHGEVLNGRRGTADGVSVDLARGVPT